MIAAPVNRTAVIDMGSNSFRLVVFGHEPGGWWSLADEIREPVRVSAGMGEEGVLAAAPMERAVATASVFASFLEASGIDRVEAVATSAIRDARNRDDLLGEIHRRTGLEVRVIGGAEEAWYGYLAIVNSTTLTDGFGIDVGGGSVQAMRIVDRELREAESVRLGAVRVSEAFLPGEQAKPKQLKALREHVARTLAEFEWWAGNGGRLAAIGGTVRNLASAVQKRMELPDVDEQGFVLTRDALEETIELLAERPASERGSIRGIKPDRGDVILGGALVVAEAMERGGFAELEVAEAGLREGIFFEQLLGDGARPLIDDVRTASVENLARRFRTDPPHVAHVARLSLELFDALRDAGLHELGDDDRQLLWAAGLLHDIGMTVDYDDHHRHSHYLIVHAGLPGYSPREVDLIALIARYHRKGTPDPSELGAMRRDDDRERLLLLCGLIRLAEQLERSRDQAIASVRVRADSEQVVLEALPRPGADPAVAIWSARRGSGLLSEALDRKVEIVPASQA
jgi:exopolyphosphatase/guanosine-5'-triphosphate,3'-diphosphate pyrophosphatase